MKTHVRFLAVALSGALLMLGSAFAQENYSLWSGHKSLRLNTSAGGANIASTQTNFPVLVRLGASDSAVFTAAKATGADIRFTKANGTTRLQHQIEKWDNVGRSAAIWVLIDSVKGNDSTQLIGVHWGKADAVDSSNGKSVFSTANGYIAVWHMNEANGTDSAYDATANSVQLENSFINGTSDNATPVADTGISGRGRRFLAGATGADQDNLSRRHATVPYDLLTPTTAITASMWIRPAAVLTNTRLFQKTRDDNTLRLQFTNATGGITFVTRGNATSNTSTTNAASVGTIPDFALGQWRYITVVADSAARRIYVDGAAITLTNAARIGAVDLRNNPNVANNDSAFAIGSRPYTGTQNNYFQGDMDEFRYSGVSRSADWNKLEFENQKAAQTLVQAVSVLAAPSGLSYLANPANYVVNNMITPNTATVTGTVDSFTVSPALPAGLALNKTSGAISGTPTSATATAKYAVTATNASGSVTDSVSITVAAGLPSAPTIAYTPTTVSYTEGTAITAVTPVLGGTVDSVTVAPALPAGLVLNKTTGGISGTPTAATAAANYVFTATNLGGSAKDTINITVAAGTEVYSTWGKHKTIWINTTTNGANVAGNVTNFPVLVRFTSADTVVANSLASGGADLRFTKAGDATRLPHEIESWDSAGKTAAVWVLVDTVKGNNLAQTIRVHVGKAGAPSLSSGAASFDTANGFVAVWHMGSTGNITDATANGFTGTNRGTSATTAAVGLAGAARGFNGTNQFLGAPHNAKFNITQNLSISAWINSTSWLGADGSAEGSKYVVNKGSGQNGTALWSLRDNTSGNFIFETAPTTNTVTTPSESIALNQWHHVAGTYGGGSAKLYVDGVAVSTISSSTNLTTGNSDSVGIGRRGRQNDVNHYFKGIIDEVRVQKSLRSADWIKLEYESQKPAQTVVSFSLPVGIQGYAARLSGVASLSVKSLSSGMAFRVQGVEVASNVGARLSLVDMSGRAVWSGAFAAGMSNLVWNGLDNSGHAVPAGIYTARVTVKDASGASHVLNARVPYTH